MGTKLKLEMTVFEGQKYHLSRALIRFIESGETRHDIDSQSPPNSASIDQFLWSFYGNTSKVKVKIEWIPSEGKETLFNTLKGKKNLDVTISWFIRDTDRNTNLVSKRGTFHDVNVTNAVGSNIQVVYFTSTSFVPDLGLKHESLHAIR